MAVSTPSGKENVNARKARRDAMSEVLADGWWAVGLRGILGILFGLICLLTPGVAVQVFVILFAAYMLVDGVFAIISGIKAARHGERWGLLILEGVVDIAAGVVAVLWPAITLVALIWIIAVWATASGILMLMAAFSLNLDHGRWWLALGGIASIVFGILLIIEPLIGAVVLTMWIGAYADWRGDFPQAAARTIASLGCRNSTLIPPNRYSVALTQTRARSSQIPLRNKGNTRILTDQNRDERYQT
jgi:uncharacterized membrane protein HdeD (DUF308 family)